LTAGDGSSGYGQPSFGSPQNFGDRAAAILFYAFDAPVLAGADLRRKRLAARREIASRGDFKVA
jgi:hypothetical protein